MGELADLSLILSLALPIVDRALHGTTLFRSVLLFPGRPSSVVPADGRDLPTLRPVLGVVPTLMGRTGEHVGLIPFGYPRGSHSLSWPRLVDRRAISMKGTAVHDVG